MGLFGDSYNKKYKFKSVVEKDLKKLLKLLNLNGEIKCFTYVNDCEKLHLIYFWISFLFKLY